MSKGFVFTLISVLLSIQVQAAPGKNVLEKVSKKYRSSKLVEMTVEKSVMSDLLGKETKYNGKIYIGGGMFRWENNKPEKTLLVFDGKTIWSEQAPPPEFGGPVQVARGKVDKKTSSHILISSLMGTDLEKNFKIVNEKQDGDLLRMDIEPKQNDLTVTDMKIVVNTKSNVMEEVSYKDDIGNLTTLAFSDIKFKAKENKKLFKYQPPKDAQVTDL